MIHTLGLLGLFFVMILQVIIPWIPAEIIVIGSTKIYGIFLTTFVAGSGLLIGSLLCYYLGMHLDNKFAKYVDKNKLQGIKKRLRQHENVLLLIRILPYNPSDIISYATGALHIPLKKVIPFTIVTSYVRCFLLAMLSTIAVDLASISFVLLILMCSGGLTYYYISRK